MQQHHLPGEREAAQGDGEVSGTAIECAIHEASLVFDTHSDWALPCPSAKVPAGWITFGIDMDLESAMYMAANSMLDLIQQKLKVSYGRVIVWHV